jgi:energy-coupling factor transporter ATP-binding protein EcfA2
MADRLERADLHRDLESLVPVSVSGAPVDTVPARVRASWLRSQEYGVPQADIRPVFTGSYDEGSLFYECGRDVLTDLHHTLAAEPVSLMLTDAEGLVLNRLCGDHDLLRELDTVHLAPGFAYSEREAGTNGLGLALADRLPTLVRAEEHYALSLCTYTCAAAPVLDPVSGRLEGSVNITTRSQSSSELLLALAQAAAGNTSALMLARSRGRRPRPRRRGEVFRVEVPRLEPGSGAFRSTSTGWTAALASAAAGLGSGHVVAAVGERGSGRTTLLAQAERAGRPRDRILAAHPPDPEDADTWLALWPPELGKPHTAVILCDVGDLPMWVAERLRDLVLRARTGPGPAGEPATPVPFSMTAERLEDVPAPLAALVDTVVPVLPLRERPEDVLPLVHHAVRRARGRDLTVTPAAEQVLADHPWPGNVTQLLRVVAAAARRTDVIDVHHLPAEVLSEPGRRLSRIESFERDEILRVVSRPGTTMQDAAQRLGMSRATLYRKVGHYGIKVRAARPDG